MNDYKIKYEDTKKKLHGVLTLLSALGLIGALAG